MSIFSLLCIYILCMVVAVVIEFVLWLIRLIWVRRAKPKTIVFRLLVDSSLMLCAIILIMRLQYLIAMPKSGAIEDSRKFIVSHYAKNQPGVMRIRGTKHVKSSGNPESGYYFINWEYFGTSVVLKTEYQYTKERVVYSTKVEKGSADETDKGVTH